MPGLFGIFAKTPALRPERVAHLATRMADVMHSYPWMRRELRVHERFAGGRVDIEVMNPPAQPLPNGDENIDIWFDGEIFEPDSNQGSEPDWQEANRLLSDAVALAPVDGVFAMASYDTAKHELRLANDFMGYRPMYVKETSEYFAYAADVSALLALSESLPAVDEIALRQFFGFEHILGDRTWWEQIYVLPPASLWSITDERNTQQRYWSFDDLPRDLRDESEVEEEFLRLWSQSVRQRSRPGVMPFLLSGGLDSRFLLAELRDQHADVVTMTIGDEDSVEIKLADHCAKLAGVPNRKLWMSPDNWWNRREEYVANAAAHVDALHAHIAAAYEDLRSGNRYSPMNFLGDILFGGSFLIRDVMLDWPNSFGQLIRTWCKPSEFFDAEETIEITASETSKYAVGPSQDCFVLWQRGGRFTIHGQKSAQPFCEFGFPSTSKPLVELMIGALPDERRARSRFYNRTLARRFPAYFANVPWQKSGRGLAETTSVRLLRNANERFGGRLLGRSARGARVANYAQLIKESNLYRELLRKPLFVDDLLDGRASELFKRPRDKDVDARTLSKLLTLEVYLRQAQNLPLPEASPCGVGA